MAEPVIRIEGLAKTFGKNRAVDGLDLTVERGEVFGFLGPNGAGKSTTIRMMLGLIRPTGGRVEISGLDVEKRRSQALRHVGAIIEEPAFYGHLTARMNLELHLMLHGREDEGRVDRVIELVRLTGRDREPVQNFSHGMQQRLGIARAISHDPDVVILDEPSDGLDPRGRREMREIILDVARRLGKTVFLSSHLLGEMETTCDRVAIIHHGKLIYQGGVEELRRRRSWLRLRTDRLDEAAEVLRALPQVKQVKREPDYLTAEMAPSGDAAIVSRTLVERGFAVSEMSAHLETLEDVFLELTA